MLFSPMLDGTKKQAAIPSISNGNDEVALVKVIMDVMRPEFEDWAVSAKTGEQPPEIDGRKEEINRQLSKQVSRLPMKPDERLR